MNTSDADGAIPAPRLARRLGLLSLVATGVCAMMGGAINIMPVMILRSVPELGPHSGLAYAVGAIPAVLVGLVFAIFGSAMPRAGGSYIYVSRSLHPYLGFVASFSHWFALSMAVALVSFLSVPFLRDLLGVIAAPQTAAILDAPACRLLIPLAILWAFAAINLFGLQAYQRTIVPLMAIKIVVSTMIIAIGFSHSHADFLAALGTSEMNAYPGEPVPVQIGPLLLAAGLLFTSYSGFDAIAQAGGEAINPRRNLPMAIFYSIALVAVFYVAFSVAVFHVIPWEYVAERAAGADVTVPGLLAILLPGWLAVLIVAGCVVGILNGIPAMLLSVSRLVFAWAEDGIFPKLFSGIHPRFQTPWPAIVFSAGIASAGIFAAFASGNFFVLIEVLVTSMLINFLLVSISLALIPWRNPALAGELRFRSGTRRALNGLLAVTVCVLGYLLIAQLTEDLSRTGAPWYRHSSYLWLLVTALASAMFAWRWRMLRKAGIDIKERFATLPAD